MKRTKLVATLAVATLVLAVASVAGADVGGRRAGDTTRGVTDDTITVGGLGFSAFYADSAAGAQARFQRAEADGEIPGGRTIDFVDFRDDASDPSQNLEEGRALVQQEEIFAAVPVITPFLGASDFFVEEKVPFFGWGIAAGFCDNPYGFGFTGCLTPPDAKVTSNFWGLAIKEYLGGSRGKTAAVIAEDNDSGKAGVRVIRTSVEAAGFEVVYAKNPVPPEPAEVGDYTPFANDVLESDDGEPPDVVFLVLSFSRVTGLSNTLLDLGYEGELTNAVGYDPRLVSQFTGSTVFIQFAPYESAEVGNAAMQQLVDDVAAFDPSLTQLTQPVAAGYFAADMFIQALVKTGENLTVERFIKAANKKFRWSVEDTAGPTRYPAGHSRPTPCGSLVKSTGTGYTIEVPFRCGKVIDIE
jgi:ABC-type branched-subunit amino acid transport system substrate-binding protein